MLFAISCLENSTLTTDPYQYAHSNASSSHSEIWCMMVKWQTTHTFHSFSFSTPGSVGARVRGEGGHHGWRVCPWRTQRDHHEPPYASGLDVPLVLSAEAQLPPPGEDLPQSCSQSRAWFRLASCRTHTQTHSLTQVETKRTVLLEYPHKLVSCHMLFVCFSHYLPVFSPIAQISDLFIEWHVEYITCTCSLN